MSQKSVLLDTLVQVEMMPQFRVRLDIFVQVVYLYPLNVMQPLVLTLAHIAQVEQRYLYLVLLASLVLDSTTQPFHAPLEAFAPEHRPIPKFVIPPMLLLVNIVRVERGLLLLVLMATTVLEIPKTQSYAQLEVFAPLERQIPRHAIPSPMLFLVITAQAELRLLTLVLLDSPVKVVPMTKRHALLEAFALEEQSIPRHAIPLSLLLVTIAQAVLMLPFLVSLEKFAPEERSSPSHVMQKMVNIVPVLLRRLLIVLLDMYVLPQE